MIHKRAPVVEVGGGRGKKLYDKSGHIHASRDIPIKGPLGSKSGERGIKVKWPVVYMVFAH